MPINSPFIAELKHESELTKKILERVPLEKKDWKPHEKSMSLGRLATHIAQIPHWISDIINIPDYDFLVRPSSTLVASSTEELLKEFQQKLDAATHDLSMADDDIFQRKWIVRMGDKVFYDLLVKVAIRGWGYSHLYHHRGQLSVYLRLLDVPVPGMYGPSADERM